MIPDLNLYPTSYITLNTRIRMTLLFSIKRKDELKPEFTNVLLSASYSKHLDRTIIIGSYERRFTGTERFTL